MLIEAFRKTLAQTDTLASLQQGLIGEGTTFATPFGPQRLVYADYTASGRALRQVEAFIADQVLPFYANTHTESSHTGGFCTDLREEARAFIASQVGAGAECKVVFTGSGATAAINRFVALSGLADLARQARSRRMGGLLPGKGQVPVVLIGPYEHHSNILPWRESGAEVIEIPECPDGGPDMARLEAELIRAQGRPLVIGAFSAASNVTGILTDTVAVTRLLKARGALAVWDYASAGPYEPIHMTPAPDAAKDAVFLSPHKFLGGPGASGVLVLREAAATATRPTWPGGGTVAYVSPWATDYSPNLCDREEAGTPNILGDIRAALAFAVKAAVGADAIVARDRALAAHALDRLAQVPGLTVLGAEHRYRLPILSLVIHDAQGAPVHHNLVTRILSDQFGIQARAGCACAGPYGHRLLGLGQDQATALRTALMQGNEMARPGWTRLNLSWVMPDSTVDHILTALTRIAADPHGLSEGYVADPATSQFHYMPQPTARRA